MRCAQLQSTAAWGGHNHPVSRQFLHSNIDQRNFKAGAAG